MTPKRGLTSSRTASPRPRSRGWGEVRHAAGGPSRLECGNACRRRACDTPPAGTEGIGLFRQERCESRRSSTSEVTRLVTHRATRSAKKIDQLCIIENPPRKLTPLGLYPRFCPDWQRGLGSPTTNPVNQDGDDPTMLDLLQGVLQVTSTDRNRLGQGGD